MSRKSVIDPALPDVLIEKRCDCLMDMIGKRKRAYNQYAAEAARMREREAFFREPKNGKLS